MIKKMNLDKKVELVDRGLGPEIFSAIVNGIGAALALAAMVVIIVVATKTENLNSLVCSVFYGLTLFITYLFSCLYHALAYNNGKRVFRALTITSVSFLFLSMITTFNAIVLDGKRSIIFIVVSLILTVLTFFANLINFEKLKFVRIIGFLVLTVIAFATAFFSITPLPSFAVALMVVSALLYVLSFAFHIFGYQVGYFNSVGHIFAGDANAFMYFTILLYVI